MGLEKEHKQAWDSESRILDSALHSGQRIFLLLHTDQAVNPQQSYKP